MKTLYTTQVHVTGGREGLARSSDGRLEVALGLPRELGGSAGARATNPEQLFGAGYAACFESALRFVARAQKIEIRESSVTADVSLSTRPEGGFALGAHLGVRLPGIERSTAEALVAAAHQICPYSIATRGNVEVRITLASE